jgi:hypothetical protein
LQLKKKSAIAVKAKANQQLSDGRGVKGLQNSANLIPAINTRAEIAEAAGVFCFRRIRQKQPANFSAR